MKETIEEFIEHLKNSNDKELFNFVYNIKETMPDKWNNMLEGFGCEVKEYDDKDLVYIIYAIIKLRRDYIQEIFLEHTKSKS